MFRRFFFVATLLGGACLSCDARPAGYSGRLVLTVASPEPGTLLDVPALASYCERDSTLSIVAVGRDWTGALAMRGAWPLVEETRFAVGSPLGEAGSGAVALRPVTDSARAPLVGRTGTITLTPGALLAGNIEAEVPDDSTAPARLTGRFEGLAVRTGACP